MAHRGASEQGGDAYVELFVPGRVCLLGEHSDWAGGHRSQNQAILPGNALVYGTDCGIFARVRKSSSGLFELYSWPFPQTKKQQLRFSVNWDYEELIRVAKKGGYFSYACGVAATLLEATAGSPPPVTGRDFACLAGRKISPIFIDNYSTTLPIKKGLSSSAAVCVLVAGAFNKLFSLGLSTEDVMEIAYLGERKTPSKCGRMDQCVAFGRACVRMRFDGKSVKSGVVALPHHAPPIYFVVADLRAAKDTQKILQELNDCYPFPKTAAHRAVHVFLGPVNKSLVDAAERALIEGDAKSLGAILTKAQQEFDRHLIPVCTELTAPKLHRILQNPMVAPLIYGGKGVGSQGDGSIQFVCRGQEEQRKLALLLDRGFGCSSHRFILGHMSAAPFDVRSKL